MRLDHYLVEKNLAKSRSKATDLIKRGLVLVDDEVILKTGYEISDQNVDVLENEQFVSRAGEKLKKALLDFNIDLHGKIVIDIGSSTGGFTDCALQHGAKEVYAYDVGTNQMDKNLKKDSRIHLFEGTNILDVDLPNSDIILIDVSFTSIKPILKHLQAFEGEMVALIKPQFEAGHIHFKQGVLKDFKKHKEILTSVLEEARSLGFSIYDLKKSGLKGKQGNQEYVLYIQNTKNEQNIKTLVGDVLC
ncbi:MAG: TlyA family RNA methyltransferase [Tenericutes bacterium]|nr:TlyA family RNA methyltransferase [Mycoplasmatota bacterium]